MAELLIRNLSTDVIKRLKLRAKKHYRSLQGELKHIIESATRIPIDDTVIKKAKKNHQPSSSMPPEEAFAEVNAKYEKAGALLKAVRLREGLNQKDFAALIKIAQGELSKMESGKRPVGKVLAARIAKKFKSKII